MKTFSLCGAHFAPIALFTYNRLEHTRRTVEALASNELADQSDLYIFSDGVRSKADAEKVESVRRYIFGIKGFKSVNIECQANNRGLAASIISGVSQMCQRYGRVIVVEDDLITDPYFLRYLNEALVLYDNEPEVISIHGYVYPVDEELPETFFLRGADCWGWATWKRGWELFEPNGSRLLADLEGKRYTREFDFNGSFGFTAMLREQIAGKNDSWAVRWYASAFLQNRFTLYPGRSLVHNIGNDATGIHCSRETKFDIELSGKPVSIHKSVIRESGRARSAFERYFRGSSASPWERMWHNLVKFFHSCCRFRHIGSSHKAIM